MIFFLIMSSLSGFAQSCVCDSADLERLNIIVFDELFERGFFGNSDTIFLEIGSYYSDSFDIPSEIKIGEKKYEIVKSKTGVPHLYLRGCQSFGNVLDLDIDLVWSHRKYFVGMSFICVAGTYVSHNFGVGSTSHF